MSEKFLKPDEIVSIELLEKEVEKVFLLKDKGLVRMVVATIIANRMPLDPVWLLLIAPPSSGKTEMIASISGLDFVFPISDLTVNTFASGQKKMGKETSLLLKINNGIMAFKDFTSVLSKNKDAKKEIMGQLREIFDGEYVKRTGTGDDITWRGKVGAIAGCTEIIYRHIEEMSAMGDRFIMYSIEQPDRKEVSRRALANQNEMQEKREHIKACFTFFINHVISKLDTDEFILNAEVQEQLLDVADFATRVRSAVLTDFKSGLVDFVPKAEMPMRVAGQLYTLGAAFIAINRASPHIRPNSPAHAGQLTKQEERLLFKTAFDSIPRTRRDAIIPLVKYKQGISTAGLATYLDLPTPSVGKYLAQVNALGICTRIKKGGSQGDTWKIKEEYRQIMLQIEDIEVVDKILIADVVGDSGGWDGWDAPSKNMDDVEQDSLDIKF